jgi:FkbM family methyltransferase
MFYYQPETQVQANYYAAWQEAGAGGREDALRALMGQSPSGNHYWDFYVSQADLREQLHPYQFLSKDDTVVTCGCHNGKIGLGLSQPLIFSTLVKHIIVVEPDPVNLEALDSYIHTYGVYNMTIVPKAIWHTEKDVEFTVCGRTESNQIGKVGNRGTQVRVPATTLDNIASWFGHIDFVHLTINGTEAEALWGAASLLKTDTKFSVAMLYKGHPMFNRRVRALRLLQGYDYHIACANGPPRAWRTDPFYFAVGTKNKGQLEKLGFEQRKEEEIPWVQ